MSDILIKNLKLPNEGFVRLLIDTTNGEVRKINFYNEAVIQTEATAIELPPHGRCISDIDVKALLHSGLSLDTDSDMDYVCELIDGLPTIVEASDGHTD